MRPGMPLHHGIRTALLSREPTSEKIARNRVLARVGPPRLLCYQFPGSLSGGFHFLLGVSLVLQTVLVQKFTESTSEQLSEQNSTYLRRGDLCKRTVGSIGVAHNHEE